MYTPPPPPPPAASPPPPPPPATIRMLIEVTPDGTSQVQLPVAVKLRTAEFPFVDDVGLHAAAVAGSIKIIEVNAKRAPIKKIEALFNISRDS
jgi:hypothetical protein